MPLYSAYDEELGEWFEGILSVEEYNKNPYLKNPKTGRVYKIVPTFNFSFKISSKPGGIPKQTLDISLDTPKTLGSLAEKRTRELGESGVEEMEYKNKMKIYKERVRNLEEFSKKVPEIGAADPSDFLRDGKSKVPYRDADKPNLSLTKMTKDETSNYILTGKKPINLDKRGVKNNG